MKHLRIIFVVIFILSCLNEVLYSQDEKTKLSDTSKTLIKLKSDNINPGGIFIAPFIGMDFPVAKYKNNSGTSMIYGARLEYSSLKIYPFVFGISFKYQKNPGSDPYKTANLLNSLDTKINSFGIGTDIILNKFLKSSFTIPFFELELNYMQVNRVVSPDVNTLDIKNADNVIGISASLGFTLYIFDILTSYNYAKEYSSASVRVRFRVPVFKF